MVPTGNDAAHAAGGEIDFNIAKMQQLAISIRRAWGSDRLPAQNCMNAGKQFAWVERFGQIIVGAHFQPDYSVDLITLGGEHDNRRQVASAAQSAADRQAIFTWHHQVENQQVEMFTSAQAIHLVGIANCLDGKTIFAKVAGQQVAQAGVIIDNQEVVGSFCHGGKDTCC